MPITHLWRDHDPILLGANLGYRQQRWPTLGWIIGELRWYAVGITAGTIAALALAIASA